MNTKHTPGPWMIFQSGNIGSAEVRTPVHLVIASGNVKGENIETAMANARLIAAAPELLEALDNLVNTPEVRIEDMQQARAALAKARGES